MRQAEDNGLDLHGSGKKLTGVFQADRSYSAPLHASSLFLMAGNNINNHRLPGPWISHTYLTILFWSCTTLKLALAHSSPSRLPSLKRDSPTCPSGNGTTYSTSLSQQYSLYCGVAFPGSDLPAVHSDSLESCILACDTYAQSQTQAGGANCVAVSWGEGNPGGNCYLKYKIGEINWGDGGMQSARRVGYEEGGEPVYSAFAGVGSPLSSSGVPAVGTGSGSSPTSTGDSATSITEASPTSTNTAPIRETITVSGSQTRYVFLPSLTVSPQIPNFTSPFHPIPPPSNSITISIGGVFQISRRTQPVYNSVPPRSPSISPPQLTTLVRLQYPLPHPLASFTLHEYPIFRHPSA